MSTITYEMPANSFHYERHAEGSSSGSIVSFWEAVTASFVPDAEVLHVQLVPVEDQMHPRELLRELIELVNGMFDDLTHKPDWSSDEVEWVSERVVRARALLYQSVRITFSTELPAGAALNLLAGGGVTGRLEVVA